MSGREIISDLERRGIRLRYLPLEDRLTAGPKALVTPEVAAVIKARKTEITAAMMEDGIIQDEDEVFEMAREMFGTTVNTVNSAHDEGTSA